MRHNAQRMLLLLLAVALLAAPAHGQNGAVDDAAGMTTRSFEIRFKELDDVMSLIRPSLSDEATVTLRTAASTITVTDAAAVLEQVAVAIEAFDRAPLDVAINVNLIRGVRRPAGRPAALNVPRLPPSLVELTRWLDYSLLGGMAVQTTEAEESTLMLGEEYRIHFKVALVDERSGRVRLRDFSLERRVRGSDGEEFVPIFDTVVNLKSGTPYVFGATRGEVSQRALFLTITADIAP